MPYQVTSSYQYSVLTLSDNVSQGKTSLEKVFILVPPGKIKKQRLWYQQHGVWQHARSEKMNIFHSKICTFWAPEWFECLQLCPSAGRWAWIPMDTTSIHVWGSNMASLALISGWELEDCRCPLARIYREGQWDIGCGGSTHVRRKPVWILTLWGLVVVKQ